MDEALGPDETRGRVGRGRRSAADVAQGVRRRRGDFVRRHLTVDEALLDRENYVYRWIKGDDARLFQLTRQDDWNLVTQDGAELKENSTDLGAVVSIVAGTRKDGSAERLYLARKPRRYAEDDAAKKDEARRKVEDDIRRLATPDAQVRDGAFYNTGRNEIRRG